MLTAVQRYMVEGKSAKHFCCGVTLFIRVAGQCGSTIVSQNRYGVPEADDTEIFDWQMPTLIDYFHCPDVFE